MSKELGAGVRVVTGWVPEDKIRGRDGRCQVGTVIYGPVHPGRAWTAAAHGGFRFNVSNHTMWEVQFDTSGRMGAVAEHLLSPIDDDDASEREAERPEEAEEARP